MKCHQNASKVPVGKKRDGGRILLKEFLGSKNSNWNSEHKCSRVCLIFKNCNNIQKISDENPTNMLKRPSTKLQYKMDTVMTTILF